MKMTLVFFKNEARGVGVDPRARSENGTAVSSAQGFVVDDFSSPGEPVVCHR